MFLFFFAREFVVATAVAVTVDIEFQEFATTGAFTFAVVEH